MTREERYKLQKDSKAFHKRYRKHRFLYLLGEEYYSFKEQVLNHSRSRKFSWDWDGLCLIVPYFIYKNRKGHCFIHDEWVGVETLCLFIDKKIKDRKKNEIHSKRT